MMCSAYSACIVLCAVVKLVFSDEAEKIENLLIGNPDYGTIHEYKVQGLAKQLFTSIKNLTFYANRMTTNRRRKPVPQLLYRGSSVYKSVQPASVYCKFNQHPIDVRGTNIRPGTSSGCAFQYRDTGRYRSLDTTEVHVTCEGFEYEKDPFIVKGSCQVDYYTRKKEKPTKADCLHKKTICTSQKSEIHASGGTCH